MFRDDHNYYFIRFPIGGGGTHLANLLSLAKNVNSKFLNLDKSKQFDYLHNIYSTNPHGHAHTVADITIQSDSWIDHLTNLDYSITNSIHTGHGASFIWCADKLKLINNKKIISLSFETNQSVDIIRKRERKITNTDTLANNYYLQELRTLYTLPIDNCPNLQIEVERLFVPYIIPLLESIATEFNFDIPLDLAQTLHTIWFQKIEAQMQ